MTEKVNNGSLAGTLLSTLEKLQNGATLTAEENEILASTLSENLSFIQNMAAQDRKSLMRQLISLDKDLYMNQDALKVARSKGVISEDLQNSLLKDESFDRATSGQDQKRANIESSIISLSNIDSVIFKVKSAIEVFNAAVEDKLIKRRRSSHEVAFDLDMHNMPEHRLDETIIKLLEFDFVKRGEDGNPLHIRGGVIEEGTPALDVERSQSYLKDKKKLHVSFKTVVDKGTEKQRPATEYSILIDQDKTIENLREAISKQYLVKSSIIKHDFKDEGELIENLYVLPFSTYISHIGETEVTHKVDDIKIAMEHFKSEVRRIEIQLAKGKGKRPLFEAWLSIIDGNTNPITGNNETVYRIPKSSVIDKYFSGDVSKYDLTVSEGSPTQAPLERRVWVYRVDLGTEKAPNKIDFLITQYGLSRTQIWAPIDKEFICPVAFAREFERSAISNRKTFKKGVSGGVGKTNFNTVATSNMDLGEFK